MLYIDAQKVVNLNSLTLSIQNCISGSTWLTSVYGYHQTWVRDHPFISFLEAISCICLADSIFIICLACDCSIQIAPFSIPIFFQIPQKVLHKPILFPDYIVFAEGLLHQPKDPPRFQRRFWEIKAAASFLLGAGSATHRGSRHVHTTCFSTE